MTIKGQIAIPSKLRRKFGMKRGTQVFIYEKNGEIVIRPITNEYIESMAGVIGGQTAQSLKGREGKGAPVVRPIRRVEQGRQPDTT